MKFVAFITFHANLLSCSRNKIIYDSSGSSSSTMVVVVIAATAAIPGSYYEIMYTEPSLN